MAFIYGATVRAILARAAQPHVQRTVGILPHLSAFLASGFFLLPNRAHSRPDMIQTESEDCPSGVSISPVGGLICTSGGCPCAPPSADRVDIRVRWIGPAATCPGGSGFGSSLAGRADSPFHAEPLHSHTLCIHARLDGYRGQVA